MRVVFRGKCIKLFLFMSFLLLFLIFSNSVFAKMSRHITILPEEMKVLPEWCQVRMKAHPRMFNHSDAFQVPDSVMRENDKWAKLIGIDIYVYTHHYCRGINWFNRYNRLFLDEEEDDRKYALDHALADFGFMTTHLMPRHSIYASNLLYLGNVYWEKKDFSNAINSYLSIMNYRPDYAPVYLRYSDLLKSVGDMKEAKRVLEIGLEKTNGDVTIKKTLDSFK